MHILLILVLSVVGIYVIAVAFAGISGSWRAKNIIKHAGRFKYAFDKNFEQTASKEIALTNAFRVFNTCPKLKELTQAETDKAIAIFLKAHKPGEVIYKVLFFTLSKDLLGIFRNTAVLEKIVAKSNTDIDSTAELFSH